MAAKKEVVFNFPRPIDNLELVGHTETRRLFLDSWANRDKYPIFPVWILTGPKGIGKATLAYNFARKVFSDVMGYDVSSQMSAGGLGDLFIVDMEHNLAQKASIGIDTIRAVIQKMQMFSMGESWRVVIIDSIDELSRGTDNTLLKTLEEPPEKTIFFLIAHSLEKVLPTIRSRSRVEKLSPLSSMELREIGVKLLPDKEISSDMIKIGGGSFGRIASLIATGGDVLFDDTKRILSDKTATSSDRLALAKRIAVNPENMSILLDVISFFGFAELYPVAASEIERAHNLHLESELATFKILEDIKKMLIDTHSHVPDLEGVDKIIYSSSDSKDIEKVFNAAQNNKNIFCTIGIHPEFLDEDFNYESLLTNSKVVGVGEIGLDYHCGNENRDQQIKLFRRQLEIAKCANLPVAIHSREAEEDTRMILKEFELKGVLHCFTSSYDLARDMLDRGFYVSASGIITFKNASQLRETFAKIPTDRIIAETDAPFCAPVPFRGKPATPAMVAEVIKCLAEIKKLPTLQMEEILWQNSHNLYPKLMKQ